MDFFGPGSHSWDSGDRKHFIFRSINDSLCMRWNMQTIPKQNPQKYCNYFEIVKWYMILVGMVIFEFHSYGKMMTMMEIFDGVCINQASLQHYSAHLWRYVMFWQQLQPLWCGLRAKKLKHELKKPLYRDRSSRRDGFYFSGFISTCSEP